MSGTVYSSPECEYEISDGSVITDGSVKRKITGTMMAGILGISPWSTPFQVACNLLGLGSEDISYKSSVITGRRLEPVIINYVAREYEAQGLFLSADDVFEKRIGDHSSWASDFDSDIFAGHVDGIVMKDDGSDFILEIKTSSNLESWLNGVPEYYYWQVALYNHFITKKDKAYVVLGMVDQDTYKNPQSWIPSDRTVKMYAMDIDQDIVSEKIEEVREWYDKYVAKGITPPYNPDNPGDVELYNHLALLAKDVEVIKLDVDYLFKVNSEIKNHEAALQDRYLEKKNYTAALKDYMISHNLTTLNTECAQARISYNAKEELDEDLLIEAGIDTSKFKRKVVSKTFTIKPIKSKEV